uniref:Peptidase M24 domain-containing protein n=1 Tax=viral metagenome TaxID=1070528 RepID=A0A6C0ELC7_9ZZZZ
MSIADYRIAGEIHKKTQTLIKSQLKPGMKLIDICKTIEDSIKEETEKQINQGIAFPTGISINNLAAHFTPEWDNVKTLNPGDVCKIDFGVHHNGCIIDSAFTINMDNKYDILLESSREAVDKVIKNLGVDVRFKALSGIAQEIVESYEMELNGKTIPIKPIDNITGHNILPWKIHGGKLLYSVPQKNDNCRVEENDIIAVEVYTSNGLGTSIMGKDIKKYSHFMLVDKPKLVQKFSIKKLEILHTLMNDNFRTLAFCPRYIYNVNNTPKDYINDFFELHKQGCLNIYPPLYEKDPNSVVAQFEETVYVTEKGVEILSK